MDRERENENERASTGKADRVVTDSGSVDASVERGQDEKHTLARKKEKG
jgi:hypothetical protein